MDKVLIWFLSVLVFIPRVVWADLAYLSTSLSPEEDSPPVEFLASVPKKKKKAFNKELSLGRLSREALIQSSTLGMKNLMVFVSPQSKFEYPNQDPADDASSLINVQIDNSLALGWKRKNIYLITNFDFQYKGVKAKVLESNVFSKRDFEFINQKPRSAKFVVIAKLFELGLIPKDQEIYWSHDLDAYQLQPIKTSDLGLTEYDIGSVDSFQAYPGKNPSWNTCSFFFKPRSNDIFKKTLEVMYEKNIDEEEALTLLSYKNPKINKRIKNLDYSYALKNFHLEERYNYAIKPIKVIHFHPNEVRGNMRTLDKFMGENSLQIRFISDRLAKVFSDNNLA